MTHSYNLWKNNILHPFFKLGSSKKSSLCELCELFQLSRDYFQKFLLKYLCSPYAVIIIAFILGVCSDIILHCSTKIRGYFKMNMK